MYIVTIKITIEGLGLIIGFIEHLENITTNNYDVSLTNLHTPKFTVTAAHIKSSQPFLAVAR
jgi:hypothetical protein